MSAQGANVSGSGVQVKHVDNPVAAIEQALQRANLLKGALEIFAKDLAVHNPLMPFPAMQSRLKRIQEELGECVKLMQTNSEILQRTVVMPTPEFPVQHTNIIDQLFQTLHDPAAQQWQDRAVKLSVEREAQEQREQAACSTTVLPAKDRTALWLAATDLGQQAASQQAFPFANNNDFTIAEARAGIEHVRHGLKRQLEVPDPDTIGRDEDEFDESDEEGSGEEHDDEEDAGDRMVLDQSNPIAPAQRPANVVPTQRAMPIDNVLRFMTRGQ